MKVTWLHVSDLHLRENIKWDQDIVMRGLISDVQYMCKEKNIKIDCIVITGDIAFSGKKEEYAMAKEYLYKLLEITDVPKERVYIVPGNHDIDRTKISKFFNLDISSRDSINTFLADETAKEFYFKKFEGYQNFISEYFAGNRVFNPKNYFYVDHLTAGPIRIAILGLNSAWLSSSDNDRNNLFIGERQLREALSEVSESDYRMAIFHHPLEWLSDVDRRDIMPLLRKNVDMCLHGHLHEPMFEVTFNPSGSFGIIAAGSSYLSRDYQNSYNITMLDFDEGIGITWLRAFTDKDGGHWFADNITYDEIKGKFQWQLSDRFSKRKEKADIKREYVKREGHVFISHSYADHEFAKRLAVALKEQGIKVWLDEWELKVGDSLRNKIESGIENAGWFLVILSSESVKSNWVNREINAGLAKELEEKRVFVLPILYRECKLPVFFKDKLYADFTKDFQVGFIALHKRLTNSY